ncbi:glycosyltransferase [Brevibacterium jeotgali]|uniref:D-inositol 3-phosphate glycosyltransferase n=1 Tax=Brevibacterium jeotgali TaxID=1262550 RepID=A0A2H1L4A2_9MICO|nr:glycosyltransferase [Brevibacterium jeotgali]TWB98679.1 D-inositol-3-phosphate glycosyltransferase [Brevibacterium jeotgali]SMY11721.1 Glycosyl transferase 4-like domain-containing protein [Brevibacterium jeotgali]
MRIVVLSLHTSPAAQPGTGDAGGLNVYVAHTAAHLVRAGHTVDILTADSAIAEDPAAVDLGKGVRLHTVAVQATSKDEMGAEAAQIACRIADDPHLSGLLRHADVVWAHYWVSGLVACELREIAAGDAAGRAAVTTESPTTGPTESPTTGPTRSPTSGPTSDPTTGPEQTRPALAMSFHTIAAVKDRDLGEARESAERLAAEKRIAATADVLLANTASEAHDMGSLLDAAPDRVRIVAPGVDTDTFRPGRVQEARRAIGMEAADLLVLCVGRMQYVKGTDVLFDALSEIAVTEPVLAGRTRVVMLGGASGEADEAGMREAARTSPAGGLVEFRGPVPARVLADWYRAADLVVVPSRSESFGFVAAEAVASGTPVLASQVGGLTHIVRPGASGVLVADRSRYTWAQAIVTLLEDPAGRAQLSTGATALRDELSWETAEDVMLEVLMEFAGPPRARGGDEGRSA